MRAFIVWAGFVGGWLLVAGPVFQAAIDLSEQDIGQEDMRAVAARYTPPPPDSPWWWLFPPVGYVLHRRRSRRIRQGMLALWTPAQRRAWARLGNKATGWLMVAVAGLLLAFRETWQLVEHYHWPLLVFWLLAAGMTIVSAVYTALRMIMAARIGEIEGEGGGQGETRAAAGGARGPRAAGSLDR
jgi:hypothetical protein